MNANGQLWNQNFQSLRALQTAGENRQVIPLLLEVQAEVHSMQGVTLHGG
jgi:hypothetical protein